MPKFVPVKVATSELAALAFAAQRANGEFVKDSVRFNPETNELVKITPNKTLMRESLTGGASLVVTEEDRAVAVEAITALQHDMTMSTLRGRKVSEFTSALILALGQEESTERDCGMLAFLPNMYEQLKARQQKEETVSGLAHSSRELGRVGEKITVNFTVINCRYLSSYNCYSVFGHDGNGNCVGFLTAKEDCTKSGMYTGKIKRVGPDHYNSGAMVTSLNFVKRVK